MDNSLDWWPAPAKLNLFLHINGRYPNGYHQLQSLFQLLDHGDELAFDTTDQGDIELLTPLAGVEYADNLIVKAAKLLQHTTCLSKGCKISLRKKLPMGGGIGGGSSNAATTLVALNHLWGCGLSLDELAHLGLQLGADVPIFVKGQTAFAQGVGEQLSAVVLPLAYYLVVFPNCHVSTAEIFNDPALPRDTPTIRFADYQYFDTRNDCQELVCKHYPNVAKTLAWLLEYAPARMTGTGACLFATFASHQEAQEVLAKIPADCCGFVAKGNNTSLLHSKLSGLKSQKQQSVT